MTKEFTPYELALDLKELGFDEECLSAFFDDKIKRCDYVQNSKSNYLSAPLYQQAFRWFREKYNLHSTIALISNSDTERRYMVMIDYIYPHKAVMEFKEYETYEKAELECLRKLIEIVKTK